MKTNRRCSYRLYNKLRLKLKQHKFLIRNWLSSASMSRSWSKPRPNSMTWFTGSTMSIWWRCSNRAKLRQLCHRTTRLFSWPRRCSIQLSLKGSRFSSRNSKGRPSNSSSPSLAHTSASVASSFRINNTSNSSTIRWWIICRREEGVLARPLGMSQHKPNRLPM